MISLNDATVHIGEAGHSCERGCRVPLSDSRLLSCRPFFFGSADNHAPEFSGVPLSLLLRIREALGAVKRGKGGTNGFASEMTVQRIQRL